MEVWDGTEDVKKEGEKMDSDDLMSAAMVGTTIMTMVLLGAVAVVLIGVARWVWALV